MRHEVYILKTSQTYEERGKAVEISGSNCILQFTHLPAGNSFRSQYSYTQPEEVISQKTPSPSLTSIPTPSLTVHHVITYEIQTDTTGFPSGEQI